MQKDRIRRRRHLCRDHKQDQQRGVQDGSNRADAVESETLFPCEDNDCNCGEEGTSEGDFEWAKVSRFDEEAASAPENRGAEHEQQR